MLLDKILSEHENEQTEAIRKLNDDFRKTFVGGRVNLTSGIVALGQDAVMAICLAVSAYSDFDEGNDPHGEHDFEAIDFRNQKIFWKIDYYDAKLEYGSENPADPKQTTRVLTIMLASEY